MENSHRRRTLWINLLIIHAEELIGLRRFLERLESAGTTLYRNNIDVTETEINILKREIAYLERLFASMKSQAQYVWKLKG